MRLSELFYLAFESLIANKLRTLLTMLGMMIGVGAVVLLVSIGNGVRNYVMSEFEGMGTNLISVQPGRSERKSFGPPGGGAKEKLTLSDVEAIERQCVNLEAVTGLMFGSVTFKYAERRVFASLIGANEKFSKILNMKLQSGEFFSQEVEYGRRVVVLGHNVANKLFLDEDPLGKLVKINSSDFRVIAVTAKAGQSLGFNLDDLVIVPTRSAMRLFNENKLFGIRAKARSRVGVDDAVAEITAILKQRHNGEVDFTVITQYSMLQTMNTIFGMLTYVLGGIAMISMIVGGIGIMNIMLVSVTERTKEIGIRRAVGARQSDILKQFLIEAVVLSMCAGLMGLLSSVSLTYIVSWIVPGFDMRAPNWILLPAFLISPIVGTIFGVWPAKKAARIETIDALRFE